MTPWSQGEGACDVSIPSEAHGGGWEGLGEDGTETALYISKIG